jgi:hypothetical protein
MKNYHLLPEGDLWKLTIEASEKSLGQWTTKAEAVAKATRIVEGNGGSLKIHLADGTIGEERTWPRVADPVKSPG